MLRWPWSSRLKHPVPRVLGGSCVTAAEIPTREGWERQGSSQTKTRRQLGCQHCKRTFHLPRPPRWHRQGEPQCRGAQAAGAGDEHLAGLRDHRSAPLTSPQSQSNDIAPSNARVTPLVVTAQSRLGCSVPMDAGLQCPHGCWPEVLGQEHTGVGVTVPHTGVQHLGQDAQTGTGRGYSSEGLQWGTTASSQMSRTCSSSLPRTWQQSAGRQGRCHSRVPQPREPESHSSRGDGSRDTLLRGAHVR